jgi:hemerythrin superfamily protein
MTVIRGGYAGHMSDYMGEPGTIVELIQRDHRLIEGLLNRFDTSPLDEWGKLFQEFVDYGLRHEIAEAEVVFPALRTTVAGSENVVEDCLAEQRAMEARLAAMEDLDPTSLEFRDQLAVIRDDQSRHSTHEEQVILPMLRGQQIADLAPPRPTSAESPGGRLAKGSVAALAGRLRALLGRDGD